jgi:hypothetical protein
MASEDHVPECETCAEIIAGLKKWVAELQALTIDLTLENQQLKAGVRKLH